jgi:adenine phosphoribosyltransferase
VATIFYTILNMNIENRVRQEIRDVHDFPIPGIVFKDITPLMMNPQLSRDMVEALSMQVKDLGITKIAGIESRGFLMGYPLAMLLDLPFVLIRKKGKLPYHKVTQSYALEYGLAEIEMHEDAVNENDRVLIHDDLLATGGSAEAAAQLIASQGAQIAGFSFIIELSFLNGKEKLTPFSEHILNLVAY